MPVYIDGKEVGVVVNTDKMHNGKYWIKVIDYDGTILKEDWLDTGDTFTLPTEPPAHDRLTFQEWTSPVDIVDGQIIVEDSDITIGATYITTSENDEFDIELNDSTGLYVQFRNINVTSMVDNNCSISVSWGDGTTDTYAVRSGANSTIYSHTYQQKGNYTIEVSATGSFEFYFSVSNGAYSLFTNIAYNNLYCCKNIRLGLEQHTSLLRMCQYAVSLETITIPKRTQPYTNLERMFYYCYNLKACVIPNSITEIGQYSFYSCYNLKNIVLPQSVNSIKSDAFCNCSNLESISISNNISELDTNAFSQCNSLNSLNLEKTNITEIESDLCNGCKKIKDIELSLPITEIGNYAFQNCYSLNTVDLSDCDNLTTINISAFNGCHNLKNITLPDNLKDIGSSAFDYCYSLNVKVYDNAGYLSSKNNSYLVLKSCVNTHISSCVVHKDCKIILSDAFENCYYLKTVSLPDGLLQLGYGAFHQCRELQSVILPNSLKDIDNAVFMSCSGLTSITIPSSVENVGGQCFQSCSSLLSVTYLGQAPNINSSQYSSCNAITKYDFRYCTTIPTLSNVSYLGHATNCQIIIPDALYDEWTTATNWVSLTNVEWVKASEVSE